MQPGGGVEIARAKVNLSLHVLGRRVDGYHELDSVVAFAELGDRLSFEPAPEFSLEISGPFAAGLSAGDDNLVLRAARALKAAMPERIPPARVLLQKNIPIAAGLGGGSADAAATLRGLARLSGVEVPSEVMTAVALALGADVPVCLASRTCRMRGAGERIEPFQAFEASPALLINPGVTVATAAVFSELGLRPGEAASSLLLIERWGEGARRADEGRELSTNSELRFGAPASPPPHGSQLNRPGPSSGLRPPSPRSRNGEKGKLPDVSAWRNDLTAPALRLAPEIGAVLEAIEAQPDAGLVRMSGSGATCFGLFASEAAARKAAHAISARHPGWWCAPTVIGSAMP